MFGRSIFMLGICAAWAWNNPMENRHLYEGDMRLTDEQKRHLETGGLNPNIPLAATTTNLWPKTILYEIDRSITNNPRALAAVNEAISDYHKYTCLRFKKRTSGTGGGYIWFYHGSGCWSSVGYDIDRVSQISLGRGCWSKGTALHEIAHSLGFYHEQSRPDRDNYIKIRWENILSTDKYNFRKEKGIDSLNVPYDLKSIMHYHKTAFTVNGKITIQTKDPAMQDVIGTGNDLSQLDIKQMNLLYKCPGVKPQPSTQPPRPLTRPSTSRPSSTARPPITIPEQTTPSPDCIDLASDCSDWKNMCSRPAGNFWGQYMRKKCKRTCGFCG